MCGLTGFYQGSIFSSADTVQEHLKKMTDAIRHRGPDSEGFWHDLDDGIAFGHRRLSILDLSDAGHQPMLSDDGRYVIAFNGEIYNHLDLRKQLEFQGLAPNWRGHSDTETLLACVSSWGIENTLKATTGMFAIALWDKLDKELTLARDRIGEKPLYWGWSGRTLLFGSELKALKQHPDFEAEIDRSALALFLRYSYIPAPYSIYQGIEKLLPGYYVQIKKGQSRLEVNTKCYWSFQEIVEAGSRDPFKGSDIEATDLLEQMIKNSLKGQMEADVPLGAFLSGGVDSSMIVALMQIQSKKPIKTFAIGFDESGYNEAEYAKAVAMHLRTEHTELYVTSKDALDIIPSLAKTYCEPFADDSQIPTYLVSKMAKQQVTVALSGDAADELFGGYNTYQFVPKVWRVLQRFPLPIRDLAARLMTGLPVPIKLSKLIDVLPAKERADFYNLVVSHWKNADQVVINANNIPTTIEKSTHLYQRGSFEQWMMAVEAQQYMIDDVLVKVDRAAMANSLEVRVPMLDHKLVEFAYTLPFDMKIRNGTGKWILREVLYRHVPRELIERPKKGFSVPLALWLRGPLREWAEPLLDDRRLNNEGYFHPEKIRLAWREHLSGKRDHSTKLWCILMFQSWLDNEHKDEINKCLNI